MNIATGAGAYQSCVAAMMAAGQQAGGINPCTPLLNGNPAGPGAPAAFTGAAANGGSNLQAQRAAAYQACVAQLSAQMRGHECTTLLTGGAPPAGYNPGGMAASNPPAPGFGAPPSQSNDPLGGAPRRPLDPLGL
jgi:hypothetical protein